MTGAMLLVAGTAGPSPRSSESAIPCELSGEPASFAATLATRSSLAITPTERGAVEQAPAATSFDQGVLFGINTKFASQAFAQMDADGGGHLAGRIAPARGLNPVDTDPQLAGRPLSPVNSGMTLTGSSPKSGLPESFTLDAAYTSPTKLSAGKADAPSQTRIGDAPQRVSHQLPRFSVTPLPFWGLEAGEQGSDTPGVEALGHRGLSTRAANVAALTSVNVTVVQQNGKLAVVSRISDLAENSDEDAGAILRATAHADGYAGADVIVNGRKIMTVRGRGEI